MAFEQAVWRGTDNYIASEALSRIVNVAILLGKPVLIKGEPGTGKTLLAQSIAQGLGYQLLSWHIKSTTRARDGLYVYDAVQRLYDSRFHDKDVNDIEQYIQLGPLGQAFTASERVVLLIDEVDKADIEFPNDLLHELDAMSFTIAETGRVITSQHRPVVVVTSNSEKELPDAFLRRCVFHYLAFPDRQLMSQIIGVHFPGIAVELLERALDTFYRVRRVEGVRKPPSTSELVDWITALLVHGVEPGQLNREVPFLGVLLKREQDIDQTLHRLTHEGRVR